MLVWDDLTCQRLSLFRPRFFSPFPQFFFTSHPATTPTLTAGSNDVPPNNQEPTTVLDSRRLAEAFHQPGFEKRRVDFLLIFENLHSHRRQNCLQTGWDLSEVWLCGIQNREGSGGGETVVR